MLGAAVLLGQQLARDPLERMLMQEFEVKGTWSNPDVKPVGRASATEDPAARAAAPGR
ncbi:MAG: AsmA-like C-terminal region-containing protein [Burkholderiales bacterium]|nr:AsmA-like C-terminal region-containing protein [Burkholderiales bacterium]